MRNYSAKLILSFVALILGFWIASCKKENENVLIDQVPPLVETNKITDSTEYTAKGGGTILAAGGSAILRRGLIWGLTEDLDTTLKTKVISGSGRGVFLAEMKGLAPGTKYYFVAFAVNEIGMAFGEIKTFSTKPLPPGFPNLGATDEASEIKATSATCGGSVLNQGDGSIVARGVCWSTNPSPTIALSTKTTDTGSIGIFASKLKGLLPSTLYYVRSYAKNSTGKTSYGNEITFTTEPDANSGTVDDSEGNTYRTAKIGTQTWMAENLKVTKYQNGDTIERYVLLRKLAWQKTRLGGYIDGDLTKKFGNYYNIYAIIDSRKICPVGWHIPNKVEWTTLEKFVGGNTIAGASLKSISELWTGNIGATDSALFTALPAGYYSNLFQPGGSGTAGVFSSKDTSIILKKVITMDLKANTKASSIDSTYSTKHGLSVRCLKD